MKRKKTLAAWIAGGALCLCCACRQDNSRYLETCKLQRESSKALAEDRQSPTCEIDIVFEKAVAPKDIARKINRRLVGHVFGYDSLKTELAIDSFIGERNRAYVEACAESYAARPDVDKGWYKYRYYIRVEEKSNYPDIITYEAQAERKEGTGAKATRRHYLNFDARTGEPVGLDGFFKPGYEHVIEPLLMRELEKKFNCVSLSQLNAKGVLSHCRLYVPDNFRPGKNEVKFLFNESEIAPYKAGEIALSIPRSLLEQIIKYK